MLKRRRDGVLSCIAPPKEMIREPTSHVGSETDVQELEVEHLQRLLHAPNAAD